MSTYTVRWLSCDSTFQFQILFPLILVATIFGKLVHPNAKSVKMRRQKRKGGRTEKTNTEWLRKPATGTKQVLSSPSGNITFMLFEYQSSHAHKNCSHVNSSGGKISGCSSHNEGTSWSYWFRTCCTLKKNHVILLFNQVNKFSFK